MLWVLCLHILVFVGGDVYVGGRGDRIRGSDEPQLVSYRVLEGVTEPFEALRPDGDIPTWKLMKAAADNKAAVRMALPALQEYGQILKNPYIFGEMPSEERYDGTADAATTTSPHPLGHTNFTPLRSLLTSLPLCCAL
jgi:hypothetical protein